MATTTKIDEFSVRSAAPWETVFGFEKHVSMGGYEYADMSIRCGNVTTTTEVSRKGLLALIEAATRLASQLDSKYDGVEWWTRAGEKVERDHGEECDSSSDDSGD
jgi:hypothetical protein